MMLCEFIKDISENYCVGVDDGEVMLIPLKEKSMVDKIKEYMYFV